MARTFFAWSLGVLGTVFWCSVSIVGSLFDRSGRWAHGCMVVWSRWNLRLAGLRVEVSGLDHVLRDGGQVFAVNHQSMADILVLAAHLPVPFRFVAKRQLFNIPFLGWHMRRAGFIAIDRERPQRAARMLIESATRLRGGVSAVVFPEGTRSVDGNLLPFRGGGFLLALRAEVPIVPIVITGTAQLLRKGSAHLHPGTAQMVVLEPVDTRSHGDDREALTQAVREAMVRALADASPRVHEATPEPAPEAVT